MAIKQVAMGAKTTPSKSIKIQSENCKLNGSMKYNMHKGVISEEIPTAGIIEKFDALLAAVKLMAKQKAVPSAAMSPTAKTGLVLNDPKVIIPIPINAPIIVKIILIVIFSFRKILLIIAANIGDVLIMNRALAIDVNSIATTNRSVPNECETIKIKPLGFGDFIKFKVGSL